MYVSIAAAVVTLIRRSRNGKNKPNKFAARGARSQAIIAALLSIY